MAGGLSFKRVTAGLFHTCAETTTNRAYCWGYNIEGQLGDGTRTLRLTPVAVVGGLDFSQLDAGGEHTAAAPRLPRPTAGAPTATRLWRRHDQGPTRRPPRYWVDARRAARAAPAPCFAGVWQGREAVGVTRELGEKIAHEGGGLALPAQGIWSIHSGLSSRSGRSSGPHEEGEYLTRLPSGVRERAELFTFRPVVHQPLNS